MRLAGNGDALASAQPVGSFLLLAVDQQIALIEQQLHARAAHALSAQC